MTVKWLLISVITGLNVD